MPSADADVGVLAMLDPQRRTAERRAVTNRLLQALGDAGVYVAREERTLDAEWARLREGWRRFHVAVELRRHQDATAQAEREEALRFAQETRDSVAEEAKATMKELSDAREGLKVAREALERETDSKRQELGAWETSLKTLREGLDSREAQITPRETALAGREEQLKTREEQVAKASADLADRRASCRERVSSYV